ncbi:MAG: TIM barrel protein [Nocardioides sp.]
MTLSLGPLEGRVAAAPISWGVCEVPGWGAVLPPARVLSEMRDLGLHATELGPPGFLPGDPAALRAMAKRYGMGLVGGFVPLVLHDREQRAETLEQARRVADLFAAVGATVFVTALVQDHGWTRPTPPTAESMKTVGEGLAEVDEVCAAAGVVQVLHPHVGTLVETERDVALALEHTDVRWCLDTGHLRIGGVDPVSFARDAGDRVAHVHLKDVDVATAARVLTRELTLVEGVQHGLFRVLGTGDVAVDDVVVALEERGYEGWYVLEQDVALTRGLPAEGSGPVEDVQQCLDFLQDKVAQRLYAAPRRSLPLEGDHVKGTPHR